MILSALAPYATAAKVGAAIALLVASAAVGAYIAWADRTDHYEALLAAQENKWLVAYNTAAQDDIDRAVATLAAQHDAEKQHDADQQTITDISNNFGDWMQQHPINTGCGKARKAVVPGPGKDGGAGVLPETLDGALAAIRALDRADAVRCDQLNIDAIRHNAECDAVIRNSR